MVTAFHGNARIKDAVIARIQEAQQDGDLTPDVVSASPTASRLHAVLRLSAEEESLDVLGISDWLLHLLGGFLGDLPEDEGANVVLQILVNLPVGASLEVLGLIVGLACMEHRLFGMPRQALEDFDLASDHRKLVVSLRASLHGMGQNTRLLDVANTGATANLLNGNDFPELNDSSRAWLRHMRSGKLFTAEVAPLSEQTRIVAAGVALITAKRSLWARTCLLTRATRIRTIVPKEERALRRAGRLLEVKRVSYQDLGQVGVCFRNDVEYWSREFSKWLRDTVQLLPKTVAPGDIVKEKQRQEVEECALQRFEKDDQLELPRVPMPSRSQMHCVQAPSRLRSGMSHFSRVGFGLVIGLLGWLLGWSAFALLPNGPVIDVIDNAWGMNGWQRTGVALILFLAVLLICSFSGWLLVMSARWRGGDGWWVKRRHKKFVLLLRSFKDDFRMDKTRPIYLTFGWQMGRRSELHQLAEALSPIGPVICVADPKRRGLVGGVATLKCSEQDWWPAVADLMEQAELVIMLPSYSDLIRAEMQLARRIVPPNRLLFFLPETLMQEMVAVRQDDFVHFVADGPTIRPVTSTSSRFNDEIVSFSQFFAELLKGQIGVSVDPMALPGRGGFLWCQRGWRARRLNDVTEPKDLFGSKTAGYFEALAPVYNQFRVSVNWRGVYRRRWWAAVIFLLGGVQFSHIIERLLGLR